MAEHLGDLWSPYMSFLNGMFSLIFKATKVCTFYEQIKHVSLIV